MSYRLNPAAMGFDPGRRLSSPLPPPGKDLPVGQQPFGGARGSGTNDKAGSMANLARWTSPRSIKETFVPATSVGYPHQQADAP